MAPWVLTVYGVIRAIPVLDAWFRQGVKHYHDWAYAEDARDLERAYEKAAQGDTRDLMKEINEKL